MSVHWEKDNSFVHCVACAKATICGSHSRRLTAGCVSGVKLKDAPMKKVSGVGVH